MQIVPQQKKREIINIKVHILWCMNKIRNVKFKDAHNLVHEKTEFKVMHMIFSIRGEIISTRFKFKDVKSRAARIFVHQ